LRNLRVIVCLASLRILLSVGVMAQGVAAQSKTNPVADVRAVATIGRARFTVLTPQLIRMEWAADGKFEDHASLVFLNRELPVPSYTKSISDQPHRLVLQTQALKLTYEPEADGRFTAKDLTIELTVNGKPVIWHPGLADPDNLQGTTRTLDNSHGAKDLEEPIGPGLVSRSGWVLVDDSTRPLFDSDNFSFTEGEKSQWPWVIERPAGERQDWYFLGYGHDYRKALGDFVRVAGRIPLPPRFAFGTWWSRWWAYSDQQIEALVNDFRDRNIPLDVVVMDMDWHISGEQLQEQHQVDQSGQPRLGWTGYTWNHILFPDPEAFLSGLHASGLKTALNLHPASGIQPWESAYPAMARAMGIDPATKKYVPFDITDKKYATNYMDLVLHPLEKQGINFWWLDWQQEPHTKIPGVNNTWWLNYVHFTDQQREGKRPLLFHRWGGLGNHRYEIGFSGDTSSTWDELAFQPWFTATAANVGYAYWSHDMGGFNSRSVDPELFTRWIQFGTFSPILRTHATKNPGNERRIWAYPEPYSSVLRSSFQLRYALQPYIYTEARRTYDTGVAFVHPLYYDWPDTEEAYTNPNEYMFGDEMFVAPVTKAGDKDTGLSEEKVWLPPGEWTEWPTGRQFNGPATLERTFSIDQTPVYLRAGAIVPMQPPMQYTGEKPVDPLIVNIWPLKPGTASVYTVYEDSENGVDYQNGVFARTPIQARQSGDELRVEIGPVQGSFPGMLRARTYEIRLPDDWPPVAVAVNGIALKRAGTLGKDGWSYQGNSLMTVIPIPRESVERTVTIEVRRANGLTAHRSELDGFAGAMSRLGSAFDEMQKLSPIMDPPDSIGAAMQTGDRLTYHPERAREELARFNELLSKAQSDIAAMRTSFDEQFEDNLRQHPPGPRVPLSAVQSRKEMLLQALKNAQSLTSQAAQ
jgi:alpha-glucosidase (family GH31 glycosyl hydrolase)